MNISLFKDVSSVKNPQIINLVDYLYNIRDGKWQDIVIKCRNIKDKKERDSFKNTMPTACMSGEFSYRNNESILSHNGYIAIDIDYVNDITLAKRRLIKDRYVASVFSSVSGYGLRVIFRIEPQKHNIAFKSICQYIYNKYSINCDINGGLSKPYIVSFDPDAYINPDFNDVPVFKDYIKETIVKNIPSYIHNSDDFINVYKQILGRRINICESYDDWIKVGFGISEEFGENGRLYFHELSRISDKYNYTNCDKQYTSCLKHSISSGQKINIRSFYYLAKINGINISSEKTKEIIRVTKRSKKAGLSISQISNNLKEKAGITDSDNFIERIYKSDEKGDFEDSEESIIETLELFISNNYNLKLNEVTGFFEDNGRVINSNAMNSIYISAKKILPKLDYNLMLRLLKSDFIASYNPFFEFFNSDGIPVVLNANPKEDDVKYESPLIDELSKCIITEEGKEEYTNFFLRKWLVSIVSAAHKVHSPLLLCLLGAQNTGKTEFFRRLMPEELKSYYAESKLDKEKDDEILMCENLIIMDDELGGKSKSDAIKINNLTSKQYFSLRRPYAESNEKILRIAVLCGTSNYFSVLTDPTGNRRIIPVIVKDIDKERYNSINKKDLFMEMYQLYKQGFDWRITSKDLIMLNEDDERFSIVIKERELILKYFEPGDEDFLSSTEVLVELELLTKQKLSINVIGRQLEDIGFTKKTVRYGAFNSKTKKAWCVNKINRDFTGNVPF